MTILNHLVFLPSIGHNSMKKNKLAILYIIVFFCSHEVSRAEITESYHGIGQVTVLSGQAIYLPFEARINTCLVRPGQYIKKNQPIFTLETSVLEREVHKLELEHLELKQSLYDLKKNKINITEEALNLSQALQETEYAKKRWQDSEKLLEAGIISKEEYIWDKRRHQQSLDNYNKQAVMHKHINDQAIYREKYMLVNKRIERSETRLKTIKRYLKAPTIVAGHEGLVLPVKLKTSEFYCHPGEKILSEQAIFWLAPVQNMRVELKMDQTELSQVKKGDKAEIIYPGYSAQKHSSEVIEIEAIPESSMMPAKYKVYLKVEEGQNLRLGTQARVKIDFDK